MRRIASLLLAVGLLAAPAHLSAQEPPSLSGEDSVLVVLLTGQYEAATAARDWAQALRCATRIGELTRDANVLHKIGHLYERGSTEMPKDDAEALRVFRLAADLGHGEAQHHVGMRYLEGNGVERDRARGVSLLEQSARKYYRPADSVLKVLDEAASAATKCAETELRRIGYIALGNAGDVFREQQRFLHIREKAPTMAELRGDVVTLVGPSPSWPHRQFDLAEVRGFVGVTERAIAGTEVTTQDLNQLTDASAAGAREVEQVRAACMPR